MGKVRLKEIARLAGVSISTVSRVVNEPDQVNSETRDEVYKVMRELGYQAGFKSGSSRGSSVVGVISPTMETEFFMDFVLSLEKELQPYNMYPLLINSRWEFSLSSFLSSNNGWVDMVDMAVLINMEIDERGHQFLKDKGVLTAAVHSRNNHCFSVLNNNYLGGFDAAEYLWNKGYRKPGIIKWSDSSHSYQSDRLTGFMKFMESKGVESRELPMERSSMSIAGGAASTERILKGNDLDVLFYTSDTMAIGGIEYCRKHKIRIPEEIGIMGFDDIRMASSLNLTTMKQFIPAKARTIVDYLIQTRDAVLPAEYPAEVTMTPVLVERQTT